MRQINLINLMAKSIMPVILVLLLTAISFATETTNQELPTTYIPSLIKNTTFNPEGLNPELFAAEAFILHFKDFADIRDVTFLESASLIPYEDGDLKNPVDYVVVIKPPLIKETADGTFVTVYTWSRDGGYIIRWTVEINRNSIASIQFDVIDNLVGTSYSTYEGRRFYEAGHIYFNNKLYSDRQFYAAGIVPMVNVNEHHISVDNNPAHPHSTTISVSDFPQNSTVSIVVTIAGRTINDQSGNPLVIRTNSAGSGSVVFTPAANSYTGRATINATSSNTSVILAITDSLVVGDKSDDERGGLTIERILEGNETVGNNTETFRIHYTQQALDDTGNKFTPQEILEAAKESYRIQVGTWGFNKHLGSEYDQDGIGNIFVDDGDFRLHYNIVYVKWATIGGANRVRINYPADLKDRSYFSSTLATLGHEMFHNIQYSYHDGGLAFSSGDWYSEGMARFSQMLIDPNNEYKSSSLVFQNSSNGMNGIMGKPDRTLSQFTYDYSLYWGYIHANDNGTGTIENILEEFRTAGGTPNVEGTQAISNVLGRVPGSHNSYKDSITDFWKAVYKKDPSDFTWEGKDWTRYLDNVARNTVNFTGGTLLVATDNKKAETTNTIEADVNYWASDYHKINIIKRDISAIEIIFNRTDTTASFVPTLIVKRGTTYTEFPITIGTSARSGSTGPVNVQNANEVMLIVTNAGNSGDTKYSFTIKDASTKTIEARVRNTGDASASNVPVSFYDGNPDSGGILIGTTTIPSIGVNSVATTNITWRPTIVGTRSVYVVVDRANSIPEKRKNNNQASRSIVISQSTVSNATAGFGTFGSKTTHTAALGSGNPTATFVLGWGGSDFDLVLISPNGTRIDSTYFASIPGVGFTSSDTYKAFTIEEPEAGTWAMEVTAVDVLPEGEAYELTVFVGSTVVVDLYADKESYQQRETITISANARQDDNVLHNLNVFADITKPTGESFELRLYDDGTRGDATADDGIYTNVFSDTIIGGLYSVNARITGNDLRGNYFTQNAQMTFDVIDDVPPIISITAPEAKEYSYTENITLSFTASDISGIQLLTAELDPPDPANVPTEYQPEFVNSGDVIDLAGFALGEHNLTVRARDTLGNELTEVIVFTVVDDVDPESFARVIEGELGNNEWYRSNITVLLEAVDEKSGVNRIEYNLDGSSTYLPYSSGITISEEGNTTIYFRAVDNAGNIETTKSLQVKIDKTSPMTVDNAPLEWINTDATVNLTATDNLSGVEGTYYCTDDSNTCMPATQANYVTISEEGIHYLRYYSSDIAGNNESVKSAQVRIDKTEPEITVISPESKNYSYIEDFATNFNATDILSGINTTTAALDGVLTDNLQTIDLFDFDLGSHLFTVGARDNAGNEFERNITFNVIDDVPPATTDNTDDTWHIADISVELTSEDEKSNVQEIHYMINNGTEIIVNEDVATASITYEHDDNTITYWGVDEWGNAEEKRTVAGIKLDKTSPLTTADEVGTSGNNEWYTGVVTVTLNAVDPIVQGNPSTVAFTEYSFDNITFNTYVNPLLLSDEAIHAIYYGSKDVAGNLENTKYQTVKIDKTAPTTTDNAPAGWQANDFTVALTASDNLAGVDYTSYRVDGGAWVNGSDIAIGESGNHSIEYYSVDLAGNAEAVHTVYAALDKIPPITTDDAVTGWINNDVIVTLVSSDEHSGVGNTYYRINDGNWTEGTSITLTETGEYVIEYYSIDSVGNKESTERSATVQIDKINPESSAAISSGTLGKNEWYTSDVEITINAADAHSGVNKIEYSVDNVDYETYSAGVQITDEGTNTVYYRSVDNAGNIEDTKSITVKVDKTPPTISDDYTFDGIWTNNAQSVTPNPSDATSGISTVTTCQGSECTPELVLESPYQLTFNTEQDSINRYKAEDDAGLVSAIGEFTVKLDFTKPQTTATRIDSEWHNEDITIMLDASDPISNEVASGVRETYYILYYDEVAQPTKSLSTDGQPVITYEDDDNWIEYWSTDVAGNEEEHTMVKTIKLDKTAPRTEITKPEDGGVYANTDMPTVEYVAEDPQVQGTPSGIKSIEWTLDGETTDNPNEISNFLCGEHSLTLTAEDNANNSNQTTNRFRIVFNNTQLFVSPESLKVNPGVITVHMQLNEQGITATLINATLDGAAMDQVAGENFKFRRQNVEDYLRSINQTLDTHFEVNGWMNIDGTICEFRGEDDIERILD